MIDFPEPFRLDFMLKRSTSNPLREKLNVEFMFCEESSRLINEDHRLRFNHIKALGPIKIQWCIRRWWMLTSPVKWFNPPLYTLLDASNHPRLRSRFDSFQTLHFIIIFNSKHFSFLFIYFLLVLHVPPFKYSLSCFVFRLIHLSLSHSILPCYHQQQVFHIPKKRIQILTFVVAVRLNNRQMIRSDVEGFLLMEPSHSSNSFLCVWGLDFWKLLNEIFS